MRAPDFEGGGGAVRVWRIAESAKSTPDHAAALGSWVIDGPFHPLCHQWVLSVIHLRDIEGVRPAHRQFPEADHELMILSLNPDRPVDIDAFEATGTWGDPNVPKFLTPADLQYQFGGLTDAQAVEIAEAAIRGILAGDYSPDSDHRSRWIRVLDATVAHYKAGAHDHPAGARYA